MTREAVRFGCYFLVTVVFAETVSAQVVPGTGQRIDRVGDDFEDPNWSWVPNGAKSSKEEDKQVRYPTGYSTNKRWFEGRKRGYPDVVRRVPTPMYGLMGSEGALLLQTLHSGIPGTLSGTMQQDDFVMASAGRVGTVPVSRTPSVVTRVYLPEFKNWENRTGSQFGFRMDLKTTLEESKRFRLFQRRKTTRKQENYWPGFFIQFHSETDPDIHRDSAALIMRGDHLGHEKRGPNLQPGWWTLGMSVTPDGQVHYYAKPGVEDLSSRDYIWSSFPYNYQAEQFATMFFNVVNRDDGRSWSTPWIVDEPALYVLH